MRYLQKIHPEKPSEITFRKQMTKKTRKKSNRMHGK